MLPKWNIFYTGRNTGNVQSAKTASEAVKLACQRGKSAGSRNADGSCAKPVAVVKLSGKDLSDAIKGKWVRTRSDGSRNTSTGDFKYRPQLKAIAKGRSF